MTKELPNLSPETNPPESPSGLLKTFLEHDAPGSGKFPAIFLRAEEIIKEHPNENLEPPSKPIVVYFRKLKLFRDKVLKPRHNLSEEIKRLGIPDDHILRFKAGHLAFPHLFRAYLNRNPENPDPYKAAQDLKEDLLEINRAKHLESRQAKKY